MAELIPRCVVFDDRRGTKREPSQEKEPMRWTSLSRWTSSKEDYTELGADEVPSVETLRDGAVKPKIKSGQQAARWSE